MILSGLASDDKGQYLVSYDELQIALQQSLTSVKRRALGGADSDEGPWAYTEDTVRGGSRKLFYFESLPKDVQQKVVKAFSFEAMKNPESVEPMFADQDAANVVAAASSSQRNKAQAKIAAILDALQMIAKNNGRNVRNCWQVAAEKSGFSRATLQADHKRVRDLPANQWEAALIPKHKGRMPSGGFTELAWEYLKQDYLRLEKPSMAVCYKRLKRVAEKEGWNIAGERTYNRRIKAEVPLMERVLLREGEYALSQMYPALIRSVRELHALEHINGDGYQHNVMVEWPDGEVRRPKTWFWQDVYSRAILAYRVDKTENTDMVRLAFSDVVHKYGICSHATIDNTRAAANKWMTGGTPTRYRFTVKDDDPWGVFTMLGVQVHWTSVFKGKGHGQAKPVERAFGIGGISEYVDKHPLLAGSHTGPNPMQKPENYGSKTASLDTFMQALEEGVQQYNTDVRNTEMTRGERSAMDAFEESYQNSPILQANAVQKRLCLMPAESTKVKTQGLFTLAAGSKGTGCRNVYYLAALRDYAGQKIVVRFDPQNLHSEVYCYTLQGREIGVAEIWDEVGFNDTEAARAHGLAKRQMIKATKDAVAAQDRMSAIEAASMLPPAEDPQPMEAKIVRPFRPNPDQVVSPPAGERADTFSGTADISPFRSESLVPNTWQARLDLYEDLKTHVEEGGVINEQELAEWFHDYPFTDHKSDLDMLEMAREFRESRAKK